MLTSQGRDPKCGLVYGSAYLGCTSNPGNAKVTFTSQNGAAAHYAETHHAVHTLLLNSHHGCTCAIILLSPPSITPLVLSEFFL